MKHAYEDLSSGQFEKLIVLLCQRLLGISVQGFADGVDGGRDAKFVGTAERHPSTAGPWVGTTIIQAKHTNGYNRQFGEADFYSTKSANTVLGKEIPRIIRLRKSKELDHYMLFANRRLAGNAEADIRQHISEKCDLPIGSIYLCGTDQLELWLKTFDDIPEKADLDPLDSPLIVSPDDLAEVVQALARQRTSLTAILEHPPAMRVSYEDKNKINNMTEEYAKAARRRYLKDTEQVRVFLAAPENADLLALYESVADEFNMKVISKRKDYKTFDEVMEYLISLLYARDAVLKQREHKRLTRTMLFYMYWNCDIGERPDAEAL
jgi:hypothetical protein